MKYFLSFILSFGWMTACWAQQSELDSLQSLLNQATSHRSRIDLHIEMCKASAMAGEREAAKDHAAQALQIAEEDTAYAMGQGESYLQLAILSRAQERKDFGQKALLSFQEANKPKGIAEAYLQIGAGHENMGEYEKALDFYKRACQIKEDLGDTKGTADVYNSIGILHYHQSKYAMAIENFKKSLALHRQLKNKKGISFALNSIGAVYGTWGNYEQATEFFKKSLKIKEELGDQQGVSNALHNIGIMYFQWSDYANAIESFQKSLAIHEALDNQKGIAFSLNALGSVQFDWGNYDKALEHYQRSYALQKELGDVEGLATVLNNLGEVYIEQGDLTTARRQFEEAKELSQSIADRSSIAEAAYHLGNLDYAKNDYSRALVQYQEALGYHQALKEEAKISRCYVRMAETYLAQANYSAAIEHAEAGLTLALENGSLERQRSARQVMATAYARLADYKKAYQNHVLFKELNDKIYSEASREKFTALEASFELERKEKEILEQEREIAAMDAALYQERSERYFLWGGLIALSLIAALLLLGLTKIGQSRKLIAKQKLELEVVNSQLQTSLETVQRQKAEIENLNRLLEKNLVVARDEMAHQGKQLLDFARYNSHETRAPVARLLGLIELLDLDDHDKETRYLVEQIKQASLELDMVIKKINETLELRGDSR